MGADGGGHVTDDISLGVVETLARMRDGRWPEPEALVVLSGEDDVARTRACAQVRDGVEIRGIGAGIKGRDEAVVGEVRAVGLRMMELRRAALELHRVAVPLGIGVVAEHACGTLVVQQLLDVAHLRSPARHGVETPVQEDAELGVVVPLGQGMSAHGLPCGLVRHETSSVPREARASSG